MFLHIQPVAFTAFVCVPTGCGTTTLQTTSDSGSGATPALLIGQAELLVPET